MKEILERLQEQRQVELAKEILGSAGYTVTEVNEMKLTESRSPEITKMMDYIDDIQTSYYESGNGDEFEKILTKP